MSANYILVAVIASEAFLFLEHTPLISKQFLLQDLTLPAALSVENWAAAYPGPFRASVLPGPQAAAVNCPSRRRRDWRFNFRVEVQLDGGPVRVGAWIIMIGYRE